MTIDLTQIILAVVTLLFGLIVRYAIPYVKEEMTANQIELLRITIKTAVYAAEQLYNSDQGKEKKKYVLDLLAEQGYILDAETVEKAIDAMIEAAVKELKMETVEVIAADGLNL